MSLSRLAIAVVAMLVLAVAAVCGAFYFGKVSSLGSLPSAPGVSASTPVRAPGAGSSLLSAVAAILPTNPLASGVTYEVVHNFCDGTTPKEGFRPFRGLSEGLDGNIYGYYGKIDEGKLDDTFVHGREGRPTMFKLTPGGSLTICHKCKILRYENFTPDSPETDWAPVPVDADFYGEALYDHNILPISRNGDSGAVLGNDGYVYFSDPYARVNQIVPTRVASNIQGDREIANYDSEPSASWLMQGSDGYIYAEFAVGDGANDTPYELAKHGFIAKIKPVPRTGDQTLSATVLHAFGDGSLPYDGASPIGGMIQAADGNFYGTTSSGGATNHGTIFEMTPAGKVTILHSFGDGTVANDGWAPMAGLLEASNGNFYGTTGFDGSLLPPTPADHPRVASKIRGVVFELTPSGHYSVLHVFDPGQTYHGLHDGTVSHAKLIEASDGYLYGITMFGGVSPMHANAEMEPILSILGDSAIDILLEGIASPAEVTRFKSWNMDLKDPKVQAIAQALEAPIDASKIGCGTIFRLRVPGLTGKPLIKPIEPPDALAADVQAPGSAAAPSPAPAPPPAPAAEPSILAIPASSPNAPAPASIAPPAVPVASIPAPMVAPATPPAIIAPENTPPPAPPAVTPPPADNPPPSVAAPVTAPSNSSTPPPANNPVSPVAGNTLAPAQDQSAAAAPTSDQASGPIMDTPQTTGTETPAVPPTPAMTETQPPSPPPPPQEEVRKLETFAPQQIIQNCLVNNGGGTIFSPSRFAANYAGNVVEYEGTVARLNDRENLVVFHGGGVYPNNWDVQLTSRHGGFAPNRTYRIQFRMTYVKNVPFGGLSFRGDVVHRSQE